MKHLLGKTLAVAAAFFAVSVLLFNFSQQAEQTDAWGSEVLAEVSEGLQKVSPIPLANACGLGASSCFRCHNGRRAEAPGKDENSPWHVEHDTVNYSCAGCHKGNPRILKQAIAHKDLVANPVASPEETCASCHGDEAAAKAKIYLDKHPRLGEEVTL